MAKIVSLNKNRDFRRIYMKGRSFVSPVLVTYVFQNRMSSKRIGITTSKKTGNAVKRNRSRRIIKEAYRQIMPKIKVKADFVFVSRAKTCDAKTTDILKAMSYHLRKAGILE